MAAITRQTIQRLAVLHALGQWRRGASGAARIHKVLFLADCCNTDDGRIFTFRRYCLGEYSDEIAKALNDLRSSGAVSVWFDGPELRIRAEIRKESKATLNRFFGRRFREWRRGLQEAFPEWSYLTMEQIIRKARQDNGHGEVVFPASHPELEGVPASEAATLLEIAADTLPDKHRGMFRLPAVWSAR